MSQHLEKVRADAFSLPLEEREILAEELTESLHEIDPEIVNAWAEESDKRLARYDAGDDSGVTLDELRDELRALHPAWKL